MLQLNKRMLLVLLLVFNLTFAATCSGVSQDQQNKLAKAEDDIAQGQLAIANTLKSGEDSGALAKTDVAFLKPILQELNQKNADAIAFTKTLKPGDLSVDQQTQLQNTIKSISDLLVKLNTEGTFRIKDPTKRAAFSAAILLLNGAVSTVVTIISIKGK